MAPATELGSSLEAQLDEITPTAGERQRLQEEEKLVSDLYYAAFAMPNREIAVRFGVGNGDALQEENSILNILNKRVRDDTPLSYQAMDAQTFITGIISRIGMTGVHCRVEEERHGKNTVPFLIFSIQEEDVRLS